MIGNEILEKRPWIGWLVLSAAILFLGVSSMLYFRAPDVEQWIERNPSTTSLIEARKAQGKVSPRLLPLSKTWVPLGQIPELLQKAVVVTEDAGFWGHQGVDWGEVRQAVKDKLQKGRSMRGASTITQQLAKNLYLSEERSFLRKAREWIIAGKMEIALGKRRILDLYFNCIEFGPGIFGIGQASKTYFGKRPAQLDLPEIVRLTAVIAAPLSLRPNQASERLMRRSWMVLERLRRFNDISQEEFQSAGDALNAFFGGAGSNKSLEQRSLQDE